MARADWVKNGEDDFSWWTRCGNLLGMTLKAFTFKDKALFEYIPVGMRMAPREIVFDTEIANRIFRLKNEKPLTKVNALTDWITERCEVNHLLKGYLDHLWKDYSENYIFAEPMTKPKFSTMLKENGFPTIRSKYGVMKKGIRLRGIKK